MMKYLEKEMKVILTVFGVLLFLLTAKGQSEKTVLKLYLPFEEGKGNLTYDKVSNLKAKLCNTKWVDGKFGKGLLFNGINNHIVKGKKGSYAFLPETRKISFFQNFDGGPFTIEVWIKPDSKKSLNTQAEIINTGNVRNAPNLFGGYRITFGWNKLYYSSGKRDSGKSYNIKSNASLNKINLDAWNHIAVTRDKNGIIRLYVNGKLAAENKEKFKIIPGKREITIGAYVHGHTFNFMGVIDDVKIYKGAKTAEEILIDFKELKKTTHN